MEAHWLVKNRVYFQRVKSHLDDDAFAYYSAEAMNLLQSTDSKTIHAIVDARDTQFYTTNIQRIFAVTSVFKEEKLGWVIALTDDKLLRIVGSTVVQLHGGKIKFCDTEHEAYRFLQQVDPTLPELPARL